MFCAQCGFETQETGGFCPNCGAQQPETSPQLAPSPPNYPQHGVKLHGRISKKALIIGGSCLVVVVVAIVLLVTLLGGGGGGNFSQDSGNAIYGLMNADQDELVFITRNALLEDSLKTDDSLSGRVAIDQSVAVINAKGDLQVVTAGGIVEIDQDVNGMISLARSGRTVAYCALNDDDDVELIRFDIASMKATVVATLANDETVSSICLSPDGQSIGYTIISDNDVVGYLSVNGGESQEIGDNCSPSFLSDGATLLYYLETDDSGSEKQAFFVRKNGDDIEMISEYDYNFMFTNRTFTEVVFVENGKTYFCKDGNDPEKILSSAISGWLTGPGQSQYEASTFVGMTATSDHDYFYFGRQGDLEEIDMVATRAQISANGQSILYLDDDGDLQIIHNLQNSLESEVRLKNADIMAFRANDDFSAIYFVDDNDELFYLNGNEPKSIADDIIYNDIIMDSNSTLYFIADPSSDDGSGQLSSTRFGSDPVEIKDASEVILNYNIAGGIYYYNVDDEKTYFITSNGQIVEIGDGRYSWRY